MDRVLQMNSDLLRLQILCDLRNFAFLSEKDSRPQNALWKCVQSELFSECHLTISKTKKFSGQI